jgi:hypothetical protein
MTTRAGVVLLVAFVTIFLAMNWGAYRGYFQDDEIDNLSWTPAMPATEFLVDALTPLYFTNNFRPVGHYYFHTLEEIAGLNFPVYVGVLQGFHVLNVWLLWMVMRRMGAGVWSAAIACCFFGLHMALFDNFWKPMYVFDLLCATFCLLSILAWLHGRWLRSFVAFWLAYKCKELAVMLPLALLCCEWWFGKRRRAWQLAPFFLVSLSFGLQGMLRNPNADNDYTFRFTLAAIGKTLPFYAGRVFLIPWAGLAVAGLAVVVRERRVWFGLAMMALFFVPMLFLPGRLFSAYSYLPFTGLAIALSGVNAAALALAVVLWLPMNIHELRMRSRETLERDRDIRTWMAAAQRLAESSGKLDAFVYSGAPRDFRPWGVEGALKYFSARLDVVVKGSEDPAAKELMASQRVGVIEWDGIRRRADIRVVGYR